MAGFIQSGRFGGGVSGATWITTVVSTSSGGGEQIAHSSLGAITGDLLITSNGGTGEYGYGFGNPSPFTFLSEQSDDYGGICYGYHFVNGTEPTDWGWGGDGYAPKAQITVIRGAASVAAYGHTWISNGGGIGEVGSACVAPSVSPASGGLLLTMLHLVGGNTNHPGTPAGMTSRAVTSGFVGNPLRVATETVSAGATGTRSGAISPNDDGRCGINVVVF